MNSKMKKTAATVCLGAAVLALTPALFTAPLLYFRDEFCNCFT